MNQFHFIVTVPRYVKINSKNQVFEAVTFSSQEIIDAEPNSISALGGPFKEPAHSQNVSPVISAEKTNLILSAAATATTKQKKVSIDSTIKRTSPKTMTENLQNLFSTHSVGINDEMEDNFSKTKSSKEVDIEKDPLAAMARKPTARNSSTKSEQQLLSMFHEKNNYGDITALPVDDFVAVDVIKLLTNMLDALGLQDLFWKKDHTTHRYQITFSVPTNRVEYMMRLLINKGVSTDYGNIQVVPIEISKPDIADIKALDKLEEFKQGIKSRLVMDSVIARVKAGSRLNFDYLSLLAVSSMISGFGLASNNVVAVVASMLISPIMGPILSFSFGTFIQDRSMVWIGFKAEVISLLVCIASGFCIGLVCSPFGPNLGWPNSEMSGRGNWQAIVFGVCIALPSGAGVALSILGDNTASLVGVAISASLLPPAVNCGLCWAYAIMGPEIHLSNPDYIVDRSENFQIGAYSLLLTIVNILCIYGVSLIYFKIKEVSPLAGRSEFWKDEVANKRSPLQRPVGEENERLARLVKELAKPKFGRTAPFTDSIAVTPSINGDNTIDSGDSKNNTITRHNRLQSIAGDTNVSRIQKPREERIKMDELFKTDN